MPDTERRLITIGGLIWVRICVASLTRRQMRTSSAAVFGAVDLVRNRLLIGASAGRSA
jgi:hypothetical protein